MNLKERGCSFVIAISLRVTVAMLCALLSSHASAIAVSPSPSNTGNYTVSGLGNLTLQEKVGNGNFATVCFNCVPKAFSGKPVGTYQYRLGGSYYWGGWHWYNVEGPVTHQVLVNAPPVPSGLTISGSNPSSTGDYWVNWNSAAGATYYQLQEYPPGGPWAIVQHGAPITAGFIDKPNGIYYYVVRACNASGCSANSASKNVTVSLLQAPGVPGAINTPSTDNNGAWTTSWSAGAGTVTSYSLEQRVNSSAWNTVQNTSASSKAFAGQSNGIHDYRVKACNAAGCSGWTAIASTTNALVPGGPPSLSAPPTSANGTVSVTWTSASGQVTAYELEERKNGGGWSNIYNNTGLAKIRSGLGDGIYDYIIRACNTVGTYKSCSSYTSSVAAIVAHTPGIPATPVVSPSPSSSGSHGVTWAAASGAVTKYQAQQRPLGGAWTTIVDGNLLSVARNGLTTGTYEYHVRACNQISTFLSCGGYSAVGQGVIDAIPGVPGNISGPTTDSDGNWTISWGAASGMIDTYSLDERVNGGSWSTTVVTHPGLSYNYTGKGDGSYEYRVRGCNGMGCNGYTPSHTLNMATQPGVPASVTLTPTTSTNGTVDVSWSAVSGVTAYKLEERLSAGSWSQVSSGLATTHQRTGLADGNYSYRVRACRTVGIYTLYGAYSSAGISLTVLFAPGLPGNIALPPSPDVDGDYALTWSSASGQVDHYQIQQSTNAGSSWSSSLYPGTTTQIFNNQPEATFTYRVRACNTSGCGNYRIAVGSVTVDVPAGSGGGNGDPSGIFTIDPNPTAYVPGLTPGQFSVDASGSANYNVPISVPSGTAGMQPSLSFIYNSRRGNGLLGMGWSLGGFSVITRCGSTIAHDGSVDGIDFDANDRFCLEGEKLMLVSGTYGADGAEYRTEIDGFTKVVSKGSAGSGPAWFQVHTKSGQTLEYGYTADARIEAIGRAEARLWAVNKIADTVGNYLAVTYEENTVASGAGGYRPQRIDYTINDNAPATSAYAAVEFEYEGRSDTTPNFYLTGSVFSVAQRLAHVKTYNGTTLVRDYRLAYGQAGVNDASRVSNIRECDGAGLCFPPAVFSWAGAGTDPVLDTEISNNSDWSKYNFIAGDWNGDGRTDVFLQNKNLTGTSKMYTANAQGIMLATNWDPADFYLGAASTSPAVPKHVLITGDWNGDGKTDLAKVTHTFWTNSFDGGLYLDLELYQSSGTGMTLIPGSFLRLNQYGGLTINEENSDKIVFGDWNGDGRTDMLHYKRPGSWGIPATAVMYTANASSQLAVVSGYTPPLPTHYATYSFQSGDWNGDGLADLGAFRKNAGTSYFYLSEGASFTQTYAATGMNGGAAELIPADYNGDGNTDLFLKDKEGSGDSYIYLSEGDGTFAAVTHTVSGWGDYEVLLGDWNGDGKFDLGRVHKTNTSLTDFYYSTGLGLSSAIYSPAWGKDSDIVIGDWNGDGLTDLFRVKTELDKEAIQYKTSHSGFDVIDVVTDGLGATIDITYAALTDGAVHSKSSGSSFPTLDIQAPLYVVSSLKESDGLGGQSETTYAYAGAKVHLHGYGFLGFDSATATEVATGIISKTTYSQTYPFQGLMTRAQVLQPDLTPMSDVSSTYASMQTHTGVFFPHADVSVNESYELDGSLVTKVTTESDYDAFGNPTNIIVTTMDGANPSTQTVTATTANDYNNDTANWYLGRLICTGVTQTLADGTTAQRTSGFEYDATSGLLTREAIEPKSSDITETGGVANCVTNSNHLNITQTTDYAHDRFGNTATVTINGDALTAARSTTTTWGELDENDTIIKNNGRFAIKLSNALNHEEYRQYDGRFGSMVRLKGPNGLPTTWDYDSFGRRLKDTRADLSETNFTRAWCTATTCSSNGVLKLITATTGAPATAVITDLLGRESVSAQVGFGGSTIIVETQYNALGQVKQKTLPYFDGDTKYWHKFTHYDLAGRSTMELLPDGQTETATNYNGLEVTVTNGLGQVSTRSSNARGELIKVTDVDSNETHYRYNPFGNLLEVEDSYGNTITSTFDVRGRKRTMNDPDMSAGPGVDDRWKYEYNGVGELLQQTDAKGQIVSTDYDRLGRPTVRSESAGAAVTTWIYDTAAKGVGKLATVTATGADAITKSFAYDTKGRPQSTATSIDGAPYLVDQTYDSAGRLQTITYPQRPHDAGRFKVRYGYDANGYELDVRNDATNALYWQAEMRDAAGQLEEFTFGNAVTTSQRFDAESGLIETIQSSSPFGVFDIQDYRYEFDVIGNLKKREDIDQGLTETFDYDTLNRLRTSTLDDGGTPPPPPPR